MEYTTSPAQSGVFAPEPFVLAGFEVGGAEFGSQADVKALETPVALFKVDWIRLN